MKGRERRGKGQGRKKEREDGRGEGKGCIMAFVGWMLFVSGNAQQTCENLV